MSIEKTKNYYFSVDAGTNSVGYAVTDTEYNLQRFKGKDMWGVHLFDEAQTAKERRTFRSSRRRLNRKQERVDLIQGLFAREIAKVDADFYKRIAAGRLLREDTDSPYTLFNDAGYTDKEYHKEYPTIHHLIYDLMNSDKPHDVRLVYLAVSWLVANRGHFLFDIESDNIDDIVSFKAVYEEMLQTLEDICDDDVPFNTDRDLADKVCEVLCSKIGKEQKFKLLKPILLGNKKKSGAEEYAVIIPDKFLKMLCGSSVKLKDILIAEDMLDKSFALSDDTEIIDEICEAAGEYEDILRSAKRVYDCVMLKNVLNGKTSISEAKIAQHEKHATDLAVLKRLVKKYAKEKYAALLSEAVEGNYVAYTQHYSNPSDSVKTAKKDDFYKFVSKILGSFDKEKVSAEDAEAIAQINSDIEQGTFMPKQRSAENGAVPHQLYLAELKKLLAKAETYLPFLSEKDANGRTVSEKIVAVFCFRIPYYVGPLNTTSPFAWCVRDPGKIYPWNFDEIVNKDASEQEFIQRMVGCCTYIPGEKALPKDSLLYREFVLLNEINVLSINGQRISPELKKELVENVFKKWRKPTYAQVVQYLLSNNYIDGDSQIGGIDKEIIKGNLTSYHDFKVYIEAGTLTKQQAEDIIARRTYTEDTARFKKWLKSAYPHLSEEALRDISRKKYTGFGRLSKALLSETYGCSKQSATGEAKSIMYFLRETAANLNELLSDEYTFADTINAMRENSAETLEDLMDGMYLSAPVKRTITRAFAVVDDIIRAQGCYPEKIFVEVTRSDEKKERTKSRKDVLLELYNSCKGDKLAEELKSELESLGENADSKLQSKKLYLYFTQFGKDMYTGERIDLGTLLTSNIWDIDHIYPRSFKKDDSILNNLVLVSKTVNNADKGNSYPLSPEIQNRMAEHWKYLHKNKAITDVKYKRLTRKTPFTEDERWDFIQRQITETSQAATTLARLLKVKCPDARVYFVKARIVSDFRQIYDMEKSRTYNDLHHAKDAYLNIVVGDVYYSHFSRQWFKTRTDNKYSIKLETLFERAGKDIIGKAKRTVAKNSALMTTYSYRRKSGQSGGLFDQNPVKAKPGLIEIKKGLPTEKYGGYSGNTNASFVIVKYPVKKGYEIMFFPVLLKHVDRFFNDEAFARLNIAEELGQKTATPDTISFPLGFKELRIDSIISVDGYRMCLRGSKGKNVCFCPFTPFIADTKTEQYIKQIEKVVEKYTESVKNKTQLTLPHGSTVTSEDNLRLYEFILSKLQNSVYKKHPKVKNIAESLKSGKGMFLMLSLGKQCQVLINIINALNRAPTGMNLSELGGSSEAGRIVISRNLSNWKSIYTDVRIINTSASGLYESRSVDLLSLL